MNLLSTALKRYYKKTKGKIIFLNGYTLNKLSIILWDEAHFAGFDSSTLSRVLKGKRLFTPTQLHLFCNSLSIKLSEEEYLFYCLNQDMNSKKGIKIDNLFVGSQELLSLITKLEKEFFYLSKIGKTDELERLVNITQPFIRHLLQYKETENACHETLQSLYLHIKTLTKNYPSKNP